MHPDLGDELLDGSALASLAAESRRALLGVGVAERLPRGSTVFGQGDPPRRVLLVRSGRVRLESVVPFGRKNGERGRFAVAHRGPGQLVGERALVGAAQPAQPTGETAVVADEVRGVSFPLAALRARMAADASLRAALVKAIAEENHAVERRLEALLVHGVDARLVLFLLDAARRWGVTTTRGVRIDASFTHAEIAGLIGATRETVTLALGKLKRDGMIDFDHRRVIVLDARSLESMSAPHRPISHMVPRGAARQAS